MLWNALRNYAETPGSAASINAANTYGSPVNCWNVAAVTNFASMFGRMNYFNDDISSWETGQVTPHCTFIALKIILYNNLIISIAFRSPPCTTCSVVPKSSTSLFHHGILGR